LPIKERITPETRASAIYDWITEQVALTEGKLHPEQIVKHIAMQIAQAESLANIPKRSRVSPGEKITTLTKATDAVRSVINEIAYLGVTPKNFMPVKMAIRTLESNGVVDTMIASVHSLLIEFMDTVIATVEPILDAGCPHSINLEVCYYCRSPIAKNEQGAYVCVSDSCKWTILYKRVKGK